MFTRKIFGALALLTTLGLGTAAAQESVVIVTRSGERLNAQLIDLSRRGFYVSIKGTERHLNPADIAGISFVGKIDEDHWDAAVEGTAVIVLRTGQRIRAELTDIGGRTPLRLTIRDNVSEREIRSNEVARIIFARPTTVVADDPAPPAGGGPGFVVAANRQWTPTNIAVRRGETVAFDSTGEIRISANQSDRASINGSLNQRYAAGSPLPQNLAGALIGRIGNGQPFAIGGQTSIEMPGTGILYLGINDDNVSDNAGQFNVVVTRRSRR